MVNKVNEKEVKVSDLGLASALVAFGFKIKRMEYQDEYIQFFFENTEAIQKAIEDYYRDDLYISAKRLFQEYKTLKQAKFSFHKKNLTENSKGSKIPINGGPNED